MPEIKYVKRDRNETTKMRRELNTTLRKEWLIKLSKRTDYLKDAGFTDQDILFLKEGKLPKFPAG